jgi:AraC-like DNA-binding protein
MRDLTSRDSDFMICDMSLIRGTALVGYPELVSSLGGDPAALLRAARIPRATVGNHEAYIGYRNVVTAVESAAAATEALDFGRQLAQRQGIEILGPVGVAARTAHTVGDGLRSISQYLSVYSPAIAVAVLAGGDPALVRVEFRIVLDRLPDHRQTIELALGVSLRILHLLAGGRFQCRAVHLPHAPITPKPDYVAYFGCRARFDEPFAGFTLAADDLQRPLASDASVHATVRAYLDSIAAPGALDVIESAQDLIRHLLPTGTLTINLVARQLGMHARTLQRRLAKQSTTYEALVDGTRRELATRLLRDTDMPMSQLAGVLGYSEQSVLVWASRRWFGAPPTAQRHLLRSGAVD